MTRRKKTLQNLAFVVLGMVAGAAVTMLAEGKALDRLYLQQVSHTMNYDDLVQELNHIQQELYLLTAQKNVTNPTLKSIKITIMNGDPMTRLEVSKFIKAHLNFLLGTQVRVFADAPTVITEVVDRQTLTVNGQRVALDLHTVVIMNDTLYITVHIRPVK